MIREIGIHVIASQTSQYGLSTREGVVGRTRLTCPDINLRMVALIGGLSFLMSVSVSRRRRAAHLHHALDSLAYTMSWCRSADHSPILDSICDFLIGLLGI